MDVLACEEVNCSFLHSDASTKLSAHPNCLIPPVSSTCLNAADNTSGGEYRLRVVASNFEPSCPVSLGNVQHASSSDLSKIPPVQAGRAQVPLEGAELTGSKCSSWSFAAKSRTIPFTLNRLSFTPANRDSPCPATCIGEAVLLNTLHSIGSDVHQPLPNMYERSTLLSRTSFSWPRMLTFAGATPFPQHAGLEVHHINGPALHESEDEPAELHVFHTAMSTNSTPHQMEISCSRHHQRTLAMSTTFGTRLCHSDDGNAYHSLSSHSADESLFAVNSFCTSSSRVFGNIHLQCDSERCDTDTDTASPYDGRRTVQVSLPVEVVELPKPAHEALASCVQQGIQEAGELSAGSDDSLSFHHTPLSHCPSCTAPSFKVLTETESAPTTQSASPCRGWSSSPWVQPWVSQTSPDGNRDETWYKVHRSIGFCVCDQTAASAGRARTDNSCTPEQSLIFPWSVSSPPPEFNEGGVDALPRATECFPNESLQNLAISAIAHRVDSSTKSHTGSNTRSQCLSDSSNMGLFTPGRCMRANCTVSHVCPVPLGGDYIMPEGVQCYTQAVNPPRPRTDSLSTSVLHRPWTHETDAVLTDISRLVPSTPSSGCVDACMQRIYPYYCFKSLLGYRKHQEDHAIVLPYFLVPIDNHPPSTHTTRYPLASVPSVADESNFPSPFPATETPTTSFSFSCFSVFDGHMGENVSLHASRLFVDHFQVAFQQQFALQQRQKGENASVRRNSHDSDEAGSQSVHRTVSTALVQALLHLDVSIHNVLRDTHSEAGSTACVAVCYSPNDSPSLVNVLTSAGEGPGAHTHQPSTSFTEKSVEGMQFSQNASEAIPHDHTANYHFHHDCHLCPSACSQEAGEVSGRHSLYLSIANLGDSRAILGRIEDGKILLETRDHRIRMYPSEEERIRRSGGVLEFGRVEGSLDFTRSLGDYRLKESPDRWWDTPDQPNYPGGDLSSAPGAELEGPVWPSKARGTSQTPSRGNIISNIADIYEWEVLEGDFLLVATDGLWDCLSSTEVANFVSTELRVELAPPIDVAGCAPTDHVNATNGSFFSEAPPIVPIVGNATTGRCFSPNASLQSASCRVRQGNFGRCGDCLLENQCCLPPLQNAFQTKEVDSPVKGNLPRPGVDSVGAYAQPQGTVGGTIGSSVHNNSYILGGSSTRISVESRPTAPSSLSDDEETDWIDDPVSPVRHPLPAMSFISNDPSDSHILHDNDGTHTPRQNILHDVANKLADYAFYTCGSKDNITLVLVVFGRRDMC